MPKQKMEAASSVQHKDKIVDGSGPPPPGSCVVANLLIFLKKIMVEEQKQYSCVKLLDPCYRLKKTGKIDRVVKPLV